MRKLHLICNAHIDPYWQWEWEEGAAAAISTFRTSADFCEEFDGFVFNHNEALLYQWIEEFEPALFERIQRLVKAGKWHIMGGWYIQPDCNMPSGESFIRQILLGKTYFLDKFGVEPSTAINFDPFGHTRGLVQILSKAGYDSYLFCRPGQSDCALPSDDFTWVGYDGSTVSAHRAFGAYVSALGKAREKVETWMTHNADNNLGMVLWGVGNHGGGPSRKDLQYLAALMDSVEDIEIVHSTPEAYFKEQGKSGRELPRHDDDLNAWAVGCYTSMIRVKQQHRLLENEIFMLEKMASNAASQGLMQYPRDAIREALRDLAIAEFHDILPGSSIEAVEVAALRLMEHGLEIVSRLKARAFFALCAGQPKAVEDQIPILAYNPHPFPIHRAFHCEFQLADAGRGEQFTVPVVMQNGKPIASQSEKEDSNIGLDWRKRAVFEAELAPGTITRFDCVLEVKKERPKPTLKPIDGAFSFRTDDFEIVVNCATGLVDKFAVGGVDVLSPGAFTPLVINDDENPWGMLVKSFRDVAGAFKLMSPQAAAAFAGIKADSIDPVRVIEDGPVRSVVEVFLEWGGSAVCQRYKIPKCGTEIEVEVRVHWNEKDKMLKWSVPTVFDDAQFLGQQAFGIQQLPTNGLETCSQKWVAVVSENKDMAFTCINDGTYGADCADGEMRVSLLRSPAYCAHTIDEQREGILQDRYTPRIDQGERLYHFWINAGRAEQRLLAVDREA